MNPAQDPSKPALRRGQPRGEFTRWLLPVVVLALSGALAARVNPAAPSAGTAHAKRHYAQRRPARSRHARIRHASTRRRRLQGRHRPARHTTIKPRRRLSARARRAELRRRHRAWLRHLAWLRRRRESWRWGGQQHIKPQRILQIQAAMVRAGLLNRMSGRWDAATVDALRRFQKLHHWQTRYVPDSRALIALDLGPPQDYLPGAHQLPPLPATAPVTAPAASGAAAQAAIGPRHDRTSHLP